MKLDFGTHVTWREIGIRIGLNQWYGNDLFIELNLWKWFVTLSFEFEFKEEHND